MDKKLPREMTGAELKSMLKSSINLKSLGGVKCPEIKATEQDLAWWRDAKVGMFFHWGLYSLLGRGEWVYHNEKLPKEEYEGLAQEFNPQNFEMSELADLACDLGANYMVMVSRHHDGFALWDSEGSYEDFTSYKTGAKRDFVKEYVEACREKDLRVGIYYSPMDWRFPGYFDPEGLPENALLMKEQCYAQVRELCENYGKIDILWYDGGWLAHKGSDTTSAWFWEPVKLNKMAKSFNEKMLVNPRSGFEGDFYCDEGSHEIKGDIIPVPWEKNMCICSGCSWGWMEDDPVSSLDDMIKMITDVVCRDGNILLNVAPDKNGKLSPEVTNRVREIGDYLRAHSESIYGTRGGPISPVDNVFGTTYKDDNIYIHVQDIEKFKGECLPITEEIIACFSNEGAPLEFTQSDKGVKIELNSHFDGQKSAVIKLKTAQKISPPDYAQIRFTGKE